MKLIHKFFLRLGLIVGYSMLGSWLFCLIEQREETYAETSRKMLERLRKIMADKYNLTNKSDFDQFVSAAAEAVSIGSKTDWSFSAGCSFTIATLTTVGYGEITPVTDFGKMFLIPYALIGLPLAMLSLKTSGELILLGLKRLLINFEKKVLNRNPQKRFRFIKSFTVIIVCKFVLICILSGVEMVMEDWSFLDGVYCWFVTFTTIGFGDYVPFAQYRDKNINTPWKFYITAMLCTVPVIAGLCLLSSLLNLLVQYSENIKIQFHHICPCFGRSTDLDATLRGNLKTANDDGEESDTRNS